MLLRLVLLTAFIIANTNSIFAESYKKNFECENLNDGFPLNMEINSAAHVIKFTNVDYFFKADHLLNLPIGYRYSSKKYTYKFEYNQTFKSTYMIVFDKSLFKRGKSNHSFKSLKKHNMELSFDDEKGYQAHKERFICKLN